MANMTGVPFIDRTFDLLGDGISAYGNVAAAKANGKRDVQVAGTALDAARFKEMQTANLIKWVVGAAVVAGLAAWVFRKA